MMDRRKAAGCEDFYKWQMSAGGLDATFLSPLFIDSPHMHSQLQ